MKSSKTNYKRGRNLKEGAKCNLKTLQAQKQVKAQNMLHNANEDINFEGLKHCNMMPIK